jgi:SAM-dependent methyltransferase
MHSPIGTSFQGAEVVDLYLYRPPYPQKIYDLLTELVPKTDRILDLGCGHGKIARPMSQVFGDVTAVDPSANMIALGKSLDHGAASNLNWVEGYAEDATFTGRYDVVVAALSIHWMDHKVVFPKLAKHLSDQHLFAVIAGDGAHHPPWESEWQDFLSKWVPALTGKPFHAGKSWPFWEKYRDYVDVSDSFEVVSEPIQQSLVDFILCQHSRDTFAISKLGNQRARFDAELGEILAPHADPDGKLKFQSRTELTAATIR